MYLVKTCGDNIWEVNLANTGQFTGENVPKTRLPGNRVSLTEPEIEAARELIGILGDKFLVC